MQKRILRHELTIHALTTKLWRVLTHSEYTEQFLFNGQYYSEWKKGSPVFSRESSRDSESLKKGVVGEVIPGISFSFVLSEVGGFTSGPVNFSYELTPDQGGIMLILTIEMDFSSDQVFRLMNEECKMMLQKIKWLAEYDQATHIQRDLI